MLIIPCGEAPGGQKCPFIDLPGSGEWGQAGALSHLDYIRIAFACIANCVTLKAMSRTSSFRLSDELHDRLDRFARRQRRGKNAVIVRAIENYLDRHERENLATEARRQSLLASSHDNDSDRFAQADETGWR